MNNGRLLKRPGEVWWAYHPWLSRVEFWNKDGSKVTTRSLYIDKPTHVHIECKPHPALILAPGDENGRGYLVCYLSSHSTPADPIPRRLLKGVVITDKKESYVYSMAPCYCDNEFICGNAPIHIAAQGMLELVKGILKRSCLLMGHQKWVAFGLEDIEPEIPAESVEEVRTCVRELLESIRHFKTPSPETERATDNTDPTETDLDNVLNSALQDAIF